MKNNGWHLRGLTLRKIKSTPMQIASQQQQAYFRFFRKTIFLTFLALTSLPFLTQAQTKTTTT
jgi:hypothetical protein